jgi:hypothetical protein
LLPLRVDGACTTLAVSAWLICFAIAIAIAHDTETAVIQLMFVAATATLSNADVVANTAANNAAANYAEAVAEELILKKAIVNVAADAEPGLDFAVTSPS